MKKIFPLITVWIAFILPSLSWGETLYDLTQLTFNDISETQFSLSPHLNNNSQMVWSGRTGPGEDTEIFLFNVNTNTVTQISGSFSESNTAPRINNNGDIVWEGVRSDGSAATRRQIFLFDKDTGTISQISDSSKINATPDINSSGNAVWSARIPFSNDEIVFFDRNTGTRSDVTSNSFIDKTPRLNNDNDVTWAGHVTSSNSPIVKEIFLFNAFDQTTTQLTSNSLVDAAPDINNIGDVVWGTGGSGGEIFYFDKSQGTTTTLSDSLNATSHSRPEIADVLSSEETSGLKKIVWEAQTSFGNIDIFHFDGTDITNITIDQPSEHEVNRAPTINSNGLIAFESGPDSGLDIFIATPLESNAIPEPASLCLMVLAGLLFAWRGYSKKLL